MRALYLRIWLTVVAALALFAVVSGLLVQRHVDQERQRAEAAVQGRLEAWGLLLRRSLPPADAPAEEQVTALREWAQRLRLPLALDAPSGERLGASESYLRREAEVGGPPRRAVPIRLDDGRTLWILRRQGGPGAGFDGPGPGPGPGMGMGGGPRGGADRPPPPGLTGLPGLTGFRGGLGLPEGVSLVALLALMFAAVAAGAWPVVRRLTRRLEALKQGVDTFGRGELHHRVDETGRDEVAALARSFNQAATRIETLLRSHQSLLANASHELRSPLARLKMALSLLEDASPAQQARLRDEIRTNIAELDTLVEEVLLASRLDAAQGELQRETVGLLALVAEEAARVQVPVQGTELSVPGDERLLRRAVRNLLENARRYGGDEVSVDVGMSGTSGSKQARVQVSDRGPGVPEVYRERIFEAFFRLPGHAEREGGIGLGLALVRQIAQRHGGQVRCSARPDGQPGSVFTLELPLEAASASPPPGAAAVP